MSDREHDIVIWGATGFTGRLVAEYLLQRHGPPGTTVRWALGGRNRDKLEALRRELGAIDRAAAELPLIVADSHDDAALRAMAGRCRVVCTTVGPYARYGTPLVRACAELGVDYCDLAGEVPWMRACVDAFHEPAARSGARIVHACGFDSIPSDLGCLALQEHARATLGAPCTEVLLHLRAAKGGMSGGTVASGISNMELAERDPAARRALVDPYALDPSQSPRGPDGADLMRVRWDPALRQWTGPFIMAATNTRIVRRSHALLGHPWGTGFRYAEVRSFGSGPRGMLRATAATAALGVFAALLKSGPARRTLQRYVGPQPGEGPSRAAREAGFFKIGMLGLGTDSAGRPARVRARIEASGDPGYKATALMLGESALCLALDRDALPARHGVLTPATAIGLPLVERLRRAGMTLAVEPDDA